jgi:hypothetical protein
LPRLFAGAFSLPASHKNIYAELSTFFKFKTIAAFRRARVSRALPEPAKGHAPWIPTSKDSTMLLTTSQVLADPDVDKLTKTVITLCLAHDNIAESYLMLSAAEQVLWAELKELLHAKGLMDLKP